MNVRAEVTLYPLRSPRLGGAIARFWEVLTEHGLDYTTGPMSTRLEGESDTVFEALRDAFGTVATEHEAVLLVKLTNARPDDALPSDSQAHKSEE